MQQRVRVSATHSILYKILGGSFVYSLVFTLELVSKEVYAPPVSVPGAKSRKNDAIPQSDLTPCLDTNSNSKQRALLPFPAAYEYGSYKYFDYGFPKLNHCVKIV